MLSFQCLVSDRKVFQIASILFSTSSDMYDDGDDDHSCHLQIGHHF